MQTCGTSLLTILQSGERDLVEIDLFEFYAPDETDLCPGNAVKRFAATSLVWFGWDYEQQAISRGDVSRFIDGKFNSVTVTLSNIDRTVGQWLSGTAIEGYRIVIRCISRSVDDDSIVLGVFRCDKPFDVDNSTVQIQAKQDLGSTENTLPWNQYAPKCPLKFKGTECLAGETLGSKSAAYQAATTCNKSYQQCKTYSNEEAFQGVRFNAITGNFKVSARRGGAGGALLSLLGLGNKRVTRQYSSQDATPYSQSVTLGLGRTNVELTPVKYADTGQYLAGQWVVGEGELTKLLNVHNVTSGWADTFQAYSEHLGKYGTDSSQAPLGFFASDGDRHSHRAYVEATILGNNPDTGDPAPTLVATVLWLKIPGWNGSSFSGSVWSDNPVDHLRFLLTEPRSLNYNSAWIDDAVAGETADYCADPLLDQSGSEDVYVSTAAGTAGTDFKRYRSTGLLDTYYFRKVLGLTTQYSAEREVNYNTFNPASPPSSVTPGTYYRKRYTANWHLREEVKAADFIFKTLLPSFRGYLVTSAQGKLQIRSERPTVTSYLRSSVSAGATSVAIEDALAWQALNLPIVYVLVGAGLATSETRKVTAIQFSTAGNSIALSATGSATASGSTLSGGTTSIQSQGTVTIGSAAAASITIDAVTVSHTPNADDTTGTIAAILATKINADATLNRYVKASWTPTLPTQIIIRSKLGTLTLASGLTSAHTALETLAHVHLPFSDVAFGALTRGNILKNSFKWPLGSKQSSYNQFVIQFNDAVQDYQPTELRENDYDHQETINKVNKYEVGGAAVDNYHQANRLVLAARYKFREGDFFCSLQSAGVALLLEEGDVICVQHSAMPDQRNLMLRIEELRVSPDHKVSLTGRLYADEQFPASADERTVSYVTGIGWVSAVPGAVTNLALSVPAAGTISGTFSFAAYIGGQTAKIYIKKPGDADYSDTGLRVTPDSSNQGAFQISGVPDGVNYVKVIPYSAAGDGPEAIASIDTTITSVNVLEYQVMGIVNVVPSLEVEVFS
jgi:hypothetical protein